MAREPQPEPYPGDVRKPSGPVLRLEYRDALGRPMSGTATIINRQPVIVDGVITPASSVVATVADGILEEQLPPNTYQVQAQLRTVDGNTFIDAQTVTLDAAGGRS